MGEGISALSRRAGFSDRPVSRLQDSPPEKIQEAQKWSRFGGGSREEATPMAHARRRFTYPILIASRSSTMLDSAAGQRDAISSASSLLSASRMKNPPITSFVSANGPSVTTSFPPRFR